MTEVAIEMGANPVSAANDMQDVLQFELKLASISTLSGNMCFPCLIGYFYIIAYFTLLQIDCNCFIIIFRFQKESSEKHLNYKLTDVKSMPRLPCGKGCDESNDEYAFSWHDFLELIFDALKMPNTTNNIDSDEPIMLFDSSYIENLESVLNSTSPR